MGKHYLTLWSKSASHRENKYTEKLIIFLFFSYLSGTVLHKNREKIFFQFLKIKFVLVGNYVYGRYKAASLFLFQFFFFKFNLRNLRWIGRIQEEGI